MESEPDDYWSCFVPPADVDGLRAYLHIVRAPDDPDRSAGPREGGPRRKDSAPHTTANRSSVQDHGAEILAHLADDVPRTFNRICVEVWDKTADIFYGTKVDAALWALVATGQIEHTNRVPILFRRKR